MTAGGPILALDTATMTAVAALGGPDGSTIAETSWEAGHRHGEELLARVDGLLRGQGLDLSQLAGIAVGTGPGAFTGLRVGLATAKGLAHALAIPLVGIPTGVAFLAAARSAGPAAAAAGPLALLLPAGPADRVLVTEAGSAVRLAGATEPDLAAGTTLVAIDLPDRAPRGALELGERARAGLGRALLGLAADRFAAGEADDLAAVVPEYVTLPRGVSRVTGSVAWSRDPR
jgi:tRNA threonylcarbamoyl adenosine modification protein YeaZ